MKSKAGRFAFTHACAGIMAFAAAALSVACIRPKFRGAEQPTPPPAGGLSPSELDANAKRKVCASTYRAARIAFVVDNSGSMGPDGTSPGTDPVTRNQTSLRQRMEAFTNRQQTLYNIINRTAELDAQALKLNSEFVGSAIGVATFPRSAGEYDSYRLMSGPGSGAEAAFPRPMSDLKGVQITEQWKQTIWNALSFTHSPAGLTPYRAALEAGQRLLKDGRDPLDMRQDILFILTDGLPTDERPSLVRQLRAALTTRTRVIYVSIYEAGKDVYRQNEKAKRDLQAAFLDPQKLWARAPTGNDGFGAGDFERYWTALSTLPTEIADARYEVSASSQLLQDLDRILEVERRCP